MIDTITLVVFVGCWPLWLVWELVLLRLRATTSPPPKTISMVARDLGWKSSALVYLWGGLATHYWWPSPVWATVAGSIVFWGVAAALLVEDAVLLVRGQPREAWPAWLRWQRFPPVVLAVGLVAGRLLFPQVGAMP